MGDEKLEPIASTLGVAQLDDYPEIMEALVAAMHTSVEKLIKKLES